MLYQLLHPSQTRGYFHFTIQDMDVRKVQGSAQGHTVVSGGVGAGLELRSVGLQGLFSLNSRQGLKPTV